MYFFGITRVLLNFIVTSPDTEIDEITQVSGFPFSILLTLEVLATLELKVTRCGTTVN